MPEPTRSPALSVAIAEITKQFGRGAIMPIAGEPGREPVAVIPSGSLGLDVATGVGGYPKGRVVELFGPESSGKTTLALHAIAQVQRSGASAAFIDAEHALDLPYAKKLGVKLEELLISQPDTGEQALEIAEQLVRSRAISLLVVDSATALVPRAALEGELGDEHLGLQARLMSQALRKLTAAASRGDACVLFTNERTARLGPPATLPEITPGNNALKFYSSLRVELRRIGFAREGERVVGARVHAKIVKNTVAPPFREAEFDILYGTGLAPISELVELADAFGFIQREDRWFIFNGERIAQGRDHACEWLRDHPAAASELTTKILTAPCLPPAP